MPSNLSLEYGPVVTAFVAAFLVAMVYVFAKGWHARSLFVKLRKENMVKCPISTPLQQCPADSWQPMPEHSLIFGHLLAVKKEIAKYPAGIHMTISFGKMSHQFPKQGFFYLDLWPVGVPFMIVTNPSMAIQATQESSLSIQRPIELREWFKSITGGPSLFDMSAEEWKPWRALFNPGFSAKNLITHVPNVVEETLAYRDVLAECAKNGEIVQLDDITLRFTMDLIGRAVLNTRLNAQKGWNPLADALLSQIRWHCSNEEVNLLIRWNPMRPFVEWYNSRQMDSYIKKEVGKRWKLHQSNSEKEFSTAVVDLAIQGYIASQPAGSPKLQRLDKEFVTVVTRQIRLFLFAGHDVTSSSIVYCFHLLSKNPSSLQRIREEHKSVLGTDASALPTMISSRPHILNNLPYTTAVMKEAMRLFPGASGIRTGAPGVDLVDGKGNRYPTEGKNIWILHQALQRNPLYWKRPDEFLPERWLVGPDHELYPVKGAWRPFEFGPRNCIGQGLVMMELTVVLAIVLAEFHIVPAYEEWEEKHGVKGARTVDGERAYQIEKGGAHPADGYPCKVSFRRQTS
ncbi:Cytochrome P450 monooxygenase aflN [Lachnellula suecica]|uniref:Cytochrome P450 monooxygenase aflN n=1 Tax=Lachnellula suecica TaxID=602035 RepID=A0A8T9C2E4_9HELO|nr:Cytochrome P450 monooxygenase aflN [Lachnellula suecica]